MRNSRPFLYYRWIVVLCTIGLTAVLYVRVRMRVTSQDTPGSASRLPQVHFIFPFTERFRYFYEPKPGIQWEDPREWLGYVPRYSINEDNLNERFSYPYKRTDRTFRILTIGDSTTFGLLVSTADNFTEQLEDLFNAQSCASVDTFEVINLGVPGYDIAYTVEHYKRRGQQYDPDLILWLINDHNYYLSREWIIAREKELLLPMSSSKRTEIERSGRMYELSQRATGDVAREHPQSEIKAMQGSFIQEFLSLTTIPVVFLLFADVGDDELTELLEQQGKLRPNTWLYKDLPALRPLSGLLDDFHPSVSGHTIIAKNLFDYLRTNGLYPCH